MKYPYEELLSFCSFYPILGANIEFYVDIIFYFTLNIINKPKIDVVINTI